MDNVVKRRGQNYRKIIQNTPQERLNQLKIVSCEKCYGTGLGNISKTEYGNFTWDGYTYCDDCCGSGYLGITDEILKIDEATNYCKNCLGDGCEKCDYRGKIDWISKITYTQKGRVNEFETSTEI